VESILSQSIQNVRVLIIDDASPDNTAKVAADLVKEDRRVTLVRHSANKGHIATYNEGIEWASADYMLILSADDYLLPGALSRAANIMDANPDVVLTHGKCIVWYDNLPFPQTASERGNTWARQDVVEEMCNSAENFIVTPTAIARTCIQKAIGGYNASLPHSGDMEMWLRFAAHGAVARINAEQAIYRKHSSAMSNSYFAEMLPDYQQRKQAFDSFFEEYSGSLPELRALRQQAYRMLARRGFQSGIRFLRRGRFSSSFRLLQWSIVLDPRLPYLPLIWQLIKSPGPEGREWALSVVREAASKLLGRA
jgi:glycosyltransferase involved in cell wall biosynthesis